MAQRRSIRGQEIRIEGSPADRDGVKAQLVVGPGSQSERAHHVYAALIIQAGCDLQFGDASRQGGRRVSLWLLPSGATIAREVCDDNNSPP